VFFEIDMKKPTVFRWAVPLVEAIKGGGCIRSVSLDATMSIQEITTLLRDVHAEND
jgi:hypothetical protein